MTVCKGIMNVHGHSRAVVFEVDTSAGPVYMSLSETTCMDRRSVAIVDAGKFLALWRASPYRLHKEIATGNIDTWRRDSKYHYAEAGFSGGITNPVPLAQVSYEFEEERGMFWRRILKLAPHQGSISFTDGITRTIWLFCNGARSFPVEVASNRAGMLSKVAGYKDCAAVDIQGLFCR